MKPSTIRICHLCGTVKRDILQHLIGECQQTRQTVVYFFLLIQTRFGDALKNELVSGSANDLLVKLLGTIFITDLNPDDMTYLRAEGFQLLKYITPGLFL